MLDIITLKVIDNILKTSKLKLSASEGMIYVNCLIHHFRDINAKKEESGTFEILKADFGLFWKFKKQFDNISKAGLVILYEDKIEFTDVWNEFIHEDKYKTRAVKKTKKGITERMEKFQIKVLTRVGKYSKDMLDEFFLYWSEHGELDRMMKFEKTKSFNIDRRLSNWSKNNYNSNGNTKKERTSFETASTNFLSD